MHELAFHAKSLLSEFYDKLDVKVEDLPRFNEKEEDEEFVDMRI